MPFRDHLAILAVLFSMITGAFLPSPHPMAHANESLVDHMGFAGKIKLGCWSQVTLDLPADLDARHFEITAPDGNGVPVAYKGALEKHSNANLVQAWFKTGRTFGKLQIKLFDDENTLLEDFEYRFKSSDVIDATVPVCLTIESSGIIAEDIRSIQSQLFGRASEVIAIQDSKLLPLTGNAYDGVQIVYLTTSDAELVQSVSKQQWHALNQWVAGGGKLIFGSGINCEAIFAESSPINEFLPGTFNGMLRVDKSSQFENYTQSRRGQLLSRNSDPLSCTRLENPTGTVELSIADNPIVVRSPYGFGQIVFSAADFDIQPFADWPGQKNYLMRLTFGQLNLNRTLTGESESRSVVRYGSKDIMGQLFFPLEKFSNVKFLNFTVVAVLIALFILCIGPGDFFLLRKLIGKMEWTWVTFSLLAIGFCGIAIFLSRATKPDIIQINQLEIIDVDAATSKIRGNIWTNIYSPQNSKCDVSPPIRNAIGMETTNMVVSWMGLPGGGLGGMRSQTSNGMLTKGYLCEFDSHRQSRLSQLPIKVSSTKAIHSNYSSTTDQLRMTSRLRLNRTTNQLQGTITNPFDFELRDCRIVFENWAYILDRPLEPGETIDVFSEMRERTAASYFSRRQQTEDSKGGDIPWNPQEDNIDRIAEIMMFYQGAGGQRYTRLTHGYQSNLDMTEHLHMQRAILFGKAQDITTKLVIDGEEDEIDYDRCRTYLRVVFPVEYKKR